MPTEMEMLFDAVDQQLDKAQSEIDSARNIVRDLRTEVDAISEVTERTEPVQGDEVGFQS